MSDPGLRAPDRPDAGPASAEAGPSPEMVCAAFLARDALAQAMGIRLIDAGAGRAVVEMTVGPDMVNGLDTCHGGVIFTLADSAMALASNSHNERAFAVHADIDWLQPAELGAVLRASATQSVRRGRTAVNDVRVTTANGTIIATFRGRTRSVGGTVLDAAG